MNQTITKVAKNFLNLIYPLHCATCKKVLDPLNELGVCNFCISQIRRNPYPPTKFHFATAYSACLYEGVLKELIHLFKYKRKISLSGILSGLMIDFIKDNDEVLADIDIITFVPLGPQRLRERGFNQSKILAFNLSEEFELPLLDILEKIRSTRSQNELSRDQRLTNLKSAFKVRNGVRPLQNLRILLIDDVMTTGATLSECSSLLLNTGAKKVRCFTLARGT